MTDTTNPPEHLPTTPEYQFAYVLATIHSTYLLGDQERVAALLEKLPMVLKDPQVQAIYLSDEVTEYLAWAYPILFGEDEEEVQPETHPDMTEDEAQEFLDALYDILFGAPDEEEDMENAFKAPELADGGVCGNPNCSCAQDEFDLDWEKEDKEELLAETDEFVIVKIWK